MLRFELKNCLWLCEMLFYNIKMVFLRQSFEKFKLNVSEPIVNSETLAMNSGATAGST